MSRADMKNAQRLQGSYNPGGNGITHFDWRLSMSALETASLLPHFGELTAASLGRWVAASLAQAAALREHDSWLYPSDPDRLESANRLHEAWRRWLEDAEGLLHIIESMAGSGAGIVGHDELRDAV